MVKDIKLMVSHAPTDPEKKKKWANSMARIQYAMWVDDPKVNFCCHCKKKYTSVDNWISRNPMRGKGKDFFVDRKCWKEYMEKKK